jgi:hypothetical protein
MVHPHPRATSTNSLSSLLAFFNLLTCTKPSDQLRRGQDICALFTRSSFPKLGYDTNPTYSSLQPLALSLSNIHKALTTVTCTQHHLQLACHLHLAIHFMLTTSPNIYLYITKLGLNMGKPMGQHSHTRYIIPNPKNP